LFKKENKKNKSYENNNKKKQEIFLKNGKKKKQIKKKWYTHTWRDYNTRKGVGKFVEIIQWKKKKDERI